MSRGKYIRVGMSAKNIKEAGKKEGFFGHRTALAVVQRVPGGLVGAPAALLGLALVFPVWLCGFL